MQNQKQAAGGAEPKVQAGMGVRTGLQAGGYGGCMRYCDQERLRCLSDPSLTAETCDDRYPVCQNACTACANTF